MLAEGAGAPAGFDADQANVFVAREGVEDPGRVGATADAGDDDVGEPAFDLDALLPRYVESRVFNALLMSAASELASRQRAMKSASDNADDLIRRYTRLANNARQSEITQEISEIVGGANALADAAASG